MLFPSLLSTDLTRTMQAEPSPALVFLHMSSIQEAREGAGKSHEYNISRMLCGGCPCKVSAPVFVTSEEFLQSLTAPYSTGPTIAPSSGFPVRFDVIA